MEKNKKISIDIRKAKILAIRHDDGGWHRQIKNEYTEISDYNKRGWSVYAIMDDGIYFFLNNINDDGNDWCKITSDL